jgi:hypothetical protein
LSLVEQVRAACRLVAERARYVHVQPERIPAYAAGLPLDRILQPELDPHSHYLGHGDDTVAFFLTLDAINFGSGYFPHLHKRPGMSGYFTVATSLAEEYRAHGPLSAQALSELAAADCAHILGQDLEHPAVAELMELYANALNDLGRYLLERYDGSFAGVIEDAGASVDRLVRLLVAMPYFNDVEPYDGLEVPFYKRAQLTCADLAIAFHGQGPGRFEDLDRLTIFADNLVPHVLRVDGILAYDEGLAARIGGGELIPAGSPQEVEIRACAVHAVELLVAALRAVGRSVSAQGLDYLLWNRGQQPGYKAIPRHRTRTVYY